MTSLILNLSPVTELTHEAFYQLCLANPELKFERTAQGELVVMSPTGGETGDQNRRVTQRLGNWTDVDDSGLAFDSPTASSYLVEPIDRLMLRGLAAIVGNPSRLSSAASFLP